MATEKMGANYSFEVKNIEIWAPTFFKYNNSFIATVLRIAQETVKKKPRAQNFLLFYNERLHNDLFLRNLIWKIVNFDHPKIKTRWKLL